MIKTNTLANFAAGAIAFLVVTAMIFAACTFVALTPNPLSWTPALRFIFAGLTLWVLARILNHDFDAE